MRTGSLKRIAAHSFLATFAVFAMGAASVAALTVPSTSVTVPKTTVTVNTPTVRVPSTAPAPAPAPKVTAPAPVKVTPPKVAPVVKQVTKPVTKVVPKVTTPVTKVVPKTTPTVKKAVPKVTNPVKQTTGTVGKTISKTGSQVTGGGTGSRPSGPSGPVSKALGTVKSLGGGATSGAGGAVRNTVGSVGGTSGLVTNRAGTVGGTTGLVNSGAGSSVGSNGLFTSQGGSQGGMTWLGGPGGGGPGGPGGFFGGGASGGDFPGGSAGMGGGGGSLAAMLVGASPTQLRNVLSHLEGCLPALPAIDRQVISMRAGVGGAPLTRPQVGQRLGLSRQAVRNTERRALNRLQYAAANTNCAGTVVGPFDVAGIGNLTPQLLFAGAVPVNVSSGTLTADMPSGGFEQTRGILPRAASPLFDLGGGGGSGPAWAIILFTVLFSVSIAALTRELRSSF